LAAAATAAWAEDPICAQYRGAFERAGRDVAAMDRVIAHIPSACAAFKGTAEARRSALAAELARAAQPGPTAPRQASTNVAHDVAAEKARRRTEAVEEREATARAAARAADDAAYGIAKATNSYASYDAYLAQYPDGAHADEARQIEANGRRSQSTDQASAADDAAFQKAQLANTYDAYNTYMSSYPSGRHAAEAKTARDALASAEPYRVHVCNKSSKNVVFAAVYQPVGDSTVWKHEGWWKAAPNDCVYIFDTGNPSFAIRAESIEKDDTTYWGKADFNQCFQTDGPYHFNVTVGVTDCPAPSTSRAAYNLTATARGEFDWSVGN
jgi:uncharacterized membrane protein